MASTHASHASKQGLEQAAITVLKARQDRVHSLAFEFIMVQELDMNIPHDSTDAQLGQNKGLNRYFNVLPYDYNRVRLHGRSSSTGDGSGGSRQQQAVSTILSLFGRTHVGPANTSSTTQQRDVDSSNAGRFINASFVQYNNGQALYIATQGPLESTTPDFWQMVWEQQCPAVVMLTRFEEQGNVKCGSYFPVNESESIRAGSFEIRNMEHQHLFAGHVIRRQLQVSDLRRSSSSSGQASGPVPQQPTLTVQHFQYMEWPDHGTPKDGRAIRFICDSVQQLVQQRPFTGLPTNQTAPGSDDTPYTVPTSPSAAVVVHCSAGIGRSGTYIAIDVLRQRICKLNKAGTVSTTDGVHESADQQARSSEGVMAAADAAARRAALETALDLPALVHEMRQQRMGMVQTCEQYEFIHKALLEELHEITSEAQPAASGTV